MVSVAPRLVLLPTLPTTLSTTFGRFSLFGSLRLRPYSRGWLSRARSRRGLSRAYSRRGLSRAYSRRRPLVAIAFALFVLFILFSLFVRFTLLGPRFRRQGRLRWPCRGACRRICDTPRVSW